MSIRITDIHKEDAWYGYRDEVIGMTGKVVGRIIDMGSWYNLTMITSNGEEIGFAFCQFEVL